MSFALQSPRGVSFNQRGNIAIPESPPSRKKSFTDYQSLPVTERRPGDGKSPSPELNSSVHGRSNADLSLKRLKASEGDEKSHHFASAAPKSPHLVAKGTSSENQAKIPGPSLSSESSMFDSPDLANQIEAKSNSTTSSKARDIFDPNDAGSERLQRQRKSRSVKRLNGNTLLPKKPPEGYNSPNQQVHPGKSIISPTLKPQSKLAVDIELRDPDRLNNASSSVEIFDQTASLINGIVKSAHESMEASREGNKPQSSLPEAAKQDDTAIKQTTELDGQVPFPPTDPPYKELPGVQPTKEVSILPQAGVPPQALSDMPREAQSKERLRKGGQTVEPDNGGEVSISSSLKQAPTEVKVDEVKGLAQLEGSKISEKSLGGQKSEVITSTQETFLAKNVNENVDATKLTERVTRENARREKILREFEKAADDKPGRQQVKDKPVQATNANFGKSDLREQNLRENGFSEKSRLAEAADSKAGRAVNPKKAKKNSAAAETEVLQVDENRSGPSKTNDLPKSITPFTPKLKSYPNVQNQSSATSNSRNDSSRMRKSMTPAYPKPPRSKQKAAEPSTALRTQSAISQLPSRSNLISHSRTGPHSVVSVKDSSTTSSSNESTPENGANTNRKIRRDDPTDKGPGVTKRVKSELSSELSRGILKNLQDHATIKKKTQTKLNVSRDVKGKGRLNDPPVMLKIESREPILVSSGSEASNASFHLEGEFQSVSVEAGPSSKRKGRSGMEPSKDKIFTQAPSSTPLDTQLNKPARPIEQKGSPGSNPAIKAGGMTLHDADVDFAAKTSTALKPEDRKPRPQTPGIDATSGERQPHASTVKKGNLTEEHASPAPSVFSARIGSRIRSSQNSSPRAPARYMPTGSDSVSNADSGSMSESENESHSQSQSGYGSATESETDTDARNLSSRELKSEGKNGENPLQQIVSKTHKISGSQENSTRRKTEVLLSSHSLGAKSSNSAKLGKSKISDHKLAEREAEEQLQREHRESIDPALKKATSVSSQAISTGASASVMDGGPVDSRSRPANFQYPSMSEMRKKRSDKMGVKRPVQDPASGPTSNKDNSKLFAPASSSSDSEEDSDDDSDSDSDCDARLAPSEAVSKGANGKNPSSQPKPNKTVQQIFRGKLVQDWEYVYLATLLIIASSCRQG